MGTRRAFLKGLVGGAVALGATGCATTRSGSGAAVQKLPEIAKPPLFSQVAVVTPSAWPSLKVAVREVIARAGGLGFIRRDQKVLIKPAVNSPRAYPATADPEVVFEVAQLVLEAGGIPVIADRTMFLRSTAAAFRALGFDEAAHLARIRCLPLDDAQAVSIAHPLATHWSDGAVPIYRPVATADHLINVCTPRTHRLGDFTMAMKNNVGVVHGSARVGMHLPGGLKDRLAEISLVVRPALVVMDGRKGFTDGGPDEGDLARLDFLAASTDPLAIDAVGLGHLRLAGANAAISSGSIWDLPMIKRAREIGVGVGSGAQIRFVGLAAEEEVRLRKQLA